MEKIVKIHRSFEESDRADRKYYQSLSPQERLEILLELNKRWPVPQDAEATERPTRVYRIMKLS